MADISNISKTIRNRVKGAIRRLDDSTDIDERIGGVVRGISQATRQSYRQPVNNFRNNRQSMSNFMNKPRDFSNNRVVQGMEAVNRSKPYRHLENLAVGSTRGTTFGIVDPVKQFGLRELNTPVGNVTRGAAGLTMALGSGGVLMKGVGALPKVGPAINRTANTLASKGRIGQGLGEAVRGLPITTAYAGGSIANSLRGDDRKVGRELATDIGFDFAVGSLGPAGRALSGVDAQKVGKGLGSVRNDQLKESAQTILERIKINRANGLKDTHKTQKALIKDYNKILDQMARNRKLGLSMGITDNAKGSLKAKPDPIEALKAELDGLSKKAELERARLDRVDPTRQITTMGDDLLSAEDYGRMQDLAHQISVLEYKARGITSQKDLKEIVQLKRNLRKMGITFDVGASKSQLTDIYNQAKEQLPNGDDIGKKIWEGHQDSYKLPKDEYIKKGLEYYKKTNPEYKATKDKQWFETTTKNMLAQSYKGAVGGSSTVTKESTRAAAVTPYTKNSIQELLDLNPKNKQLNNLYYSLRNFNGDVSNILTDKEKRLVDSFSQATKPKVKSLKAKQLSNEAENLNSTSSTPLLLPEGKSLVANTPNQAKALFKKFNQVPELNFKVKGGAKKIKIKGDTPTSDYTSQVEGLKDISVLSKGLNDVYNNFKTVFGKNFPEVKNKVLDPFDAAKGSYIKMQRQLSDELENKVVKGLGIKPKSKDSALVQLYGEKKIDLETLKTRTDNWENIVKADTWFRNKYDELLDQVNASRKQIYPNNPEKLIPRRDDYYRHFQEMEGGLGALRNIFERPSNISPELAGISDSTKPKAKWLSIAQKRTGDLTDLDAVGGYINYAKQASYATHIDPKISNFRYLKNELVEATKNVDDPATYAKVNNFIEFLEDYSNLLSGKTNPADRVAQKYLGRKTFRSLNWLNSRVKANVIVGNFASSIAQYFNTPQGIAEAGLQNYAKGTGRALTSIFNKTEMDKSNFLNERYFKAWDKFDTGKLKDVKKFAGWVTGVLDEVATKQMWSAFYEQAGSKGITNKIKYADDMTRKMVSGRGVGEVPILQSAKSFQLVAPFQLEVANMWNIQKGWLDEKAFGKFVTFALASYVLNRTAEKIRGNDVSFDPINAGIDAVETFNQEDDKVIGSLKAGGRLAGEVVSNVPLGQTAAAVYPEYGFKVGEKQMPTRREFFGEGDPTRFGTGLIGGALKDPFFKIAPSYGGMQIKKTLQGLQSFNKGYNETSSGRVRYPVDKNAGNLVKSAFFGQYSVPEAREYFDMKTTPLGEKQSEDFKARVGSGDANTFYDNIMNKRGANKKPKDYGSFYEMSKVGAAGEISLPTTAKQLSVLYEDVEKTINGYEEKKTKILYSPEYDQFERETELQELQDEMDQAIAFRKQIETERPEQIFDIGVETYKSKEGARPTEERAEWVIKQLEGVGDDDEKLKEVVNKLYEGKVLSKSVVEYLNEQGFNITKYNYGTGFRYLGGSGGSSKSSKYPNRLKGVSNTVKVGKVNTTPYSSGGKLSFNSIRKSKPITLGSLTSSTPNVISEGELKALANPTIKLTPYK